MQHGDPVRREQLAHPVEEGHVVRPPHVLEHADRDDAVVAAPVLAVVLQLEAHAAGEARRLGAGARHAQLLARERQPRDLDAVLARQMQREPAPPAADVEHPLARLQAQLGGQMRALGALRRLQVHAGLGEVGAGVVHVLVEHAAEEPLVEVVVVGDVAVAARDAVPLLEQAQGRHRQAPPPAQRPLREVAHQEHQQRREPALARVPLPLHVGLAEREPRVARDAPQRAAAADDPLGVRLAAAEHAGGPIGQGEAQGALADAALEELQVHGAPPFSLWSGRAPPAEAPP